MILKFTLWLLKKRYNWVTVMVLNDGRLQNESGGDISILEMGMVSEAFAAAARAADDLT